MFCSKCGNENENGKVLAVIGIFIGVFSIFYGLYTIIVLLQVLLLS